MNNQDQIKRIDHEIEEIHLMANLGQGLNRRSLEFLEAQRAALVTAAEPLPLPEPEVVAEPLQDAPETAHRGLSRNPARTDVADCAKTKTLTPDEREILQDHFLDEWLRLGQFKLALESTGIKWQNVQSWKRWTPGFYERCKDAQARVKEDNSQRKELTRFNKKMDHLWR